MNQPGGRELLSRLKASTGVGGPVLSLPIGPPVVGILRPCATRPGCLDENDVRALTHWRNRFASAFLHEFEADESRTARWLTEVVGPADNRILFMVDDPDGRTFGYMGLGFVDWDVGFGEADAVVRGAEAPRGAMTQALHTLLAWAQGQLGLRRLGVRVRSDNTALDFYRKVGFSEVLRVPLRAVEAFDGARQWIEDPTYPDRELSLVHMVLSEQ